MKQLNKEVKKLTVTYQMITPTFLAGSDQRRAELRLSSVKGALRYWYRAIDPKYYKWESDLFGGSGENVRQSRFLMRLHPIDWKEKKFSFRNRELDGLGYVTFSLRAKQGYKRSYLEAGQTFSISFFMREPRKEEDLDRAAFWKRLLASVWLLGHVGGLGSRSRRGFGTVALVDWQIDHCDEGRRLLSQIPLPSRAATIDKWARLFRRGISLFRDWFGTWDQRKVEHPLINDQTAFCISNRPCSDWNEAMREGIEQLASFRKEKKSVRQTAAFGLPIIIPKGPQFRPVFFPRMASPVYLRVISVGDQFVPMYTIMSTLPAIQIKDGRRINRNRRPVDIDIDTVLDNFRTYLIERNWLDLSVEEVQV